MFTELKKLLKNSYAPLTNFKVASIVVFKNNTKQVGVNVETATLNPTICAERNAIFSAIANGQKFGDVKEIHILANTKHKEDFTFPCGVCRQVIYEASNGEASIYVYSLSGEKQQYKIKDLLPNAFSGKEIN
ncbi:MAG: cytidine deaminase [Mycoplasmataceae bacterium]|nr:cytidine deaminase [Mycoplasmataceae bacterium]